MAEIILPPEENEETPQAPELNIDKPTTNSKVITIEFEAKKTNKVSTKDTNQQLYTTDTDAWFEFKETSLEGANGTYSVVFRNRHDGSIFQRTGDVVNGVAYYKIPHQEIRHAGAWRGQVVYTLGNGDTTAREFDYDVKGHILDGKDVREIVVEDFETLMSQLRSMKENAEVELANLVNTANQNETDRQAFFNDLVEDIDEFEENERQRGLNEQARESAESVRVANEEERVSKDSERDSKIDSKANKSMLLSPKYDLVHDSCVRNVDAPLDAYSVPMESGHYFVNVDERETDTTLTYEPDGVLLARLDSNNIFSPVLIENFEVDFPYISVRFNNTHLQHVGRSFYIKYLNKQNWIRVDAGTNETAVTTCIDGVETEIGRNVNQLNNDFGGRYGLVQDVHISYRRGHLNTSPSGKTVVVRQGDRESFVTSVPNEVANLFDNQGKVGFDVQARTEMLNFKAGSVK